MKQLSLFHNSQRLFHGGSLTAGKRKTARPLCGKRPIHLVLKTHRRQNLFAKRAVIRQLLRKYSERFSVKIYSLSVQHDHIHALIKIHDRKSYVAFIRSLSGQMARLLGKNLFKVSPFTRVVAWGRAYRKVKTYLLQNEKEVLGLQPYTPRKDFYARYKRTRRRPPGEKTT